MSKQEVWTSEELKKHMTLKAKKQAAKKAVKVIYPPDNARFAIGIDVGIINGFAVFDRKKKGLVHMESCKLFQLFERLRAWVNNNDIYVYIEDPNSWKNFGGTPTNETNAKRAGAGAVKQTYKHIVELLEHDKIPYRPTSIIGTPKKLNAEDFKKITGWQGVTNEHGRDAALIVFNRNKLPQ